MIQITDRPLRLAAAIGVIAVALAGALWIHHFELTDYQSVSRCVRYYPLGTFEDDWHMRHCQTQRDVREETGTTSHPSWADPVAVALALGSFAVAVGLAVRKSNPRSRPASV
jgi:hypothetical protein